MRTIDFSRSFLRFRTDNLNKPSRTTSHQPPYTLNNCVISIECRCRITDRETDAVQQFVLGAGCKTERVGVERDVWTEPNGDFVPIFGDDSFMHLKSFAHTGIQVDLYPPGSGKQPLRQTGNRAECFDATGVDLVECEGELLDSAEAIVEASLAAEPLVAVTRLSQGRYTAAIEYPVKTMNANERDMVYQTDTGPVLFPDLSAEPENLLTTLELAYSAFNCPDWIEFIVRVPTAISEDLSVFHYSKPVRMDAKNQVIRRLG